MQIKLDAPGHETRDRDPANAQLDCEAEKEGAARPEDDMQIELDALPIESQKKEGHDLCNLDRADSLHDRDPQEEETARQEGNMQSELDALFNDVSKKVNESIESNQQESDRVAAEETALIHQLKEVQYQYSLLARLDLTRSPTISARPAEEIEAIVTRAVKFTQSTSGVEVARILNSKNSDLPRGVQLIADVSDVSANVFILIDVPMRVHIFEKADILRIEYDSMFRVRLITKAWYLELCCAMHAQTSWLCEQWVKKYFQGVDAIYVRG